MTREEALTGWVIPAIRRTWNEKKCNEILKALEQEPSEWEHDHDILKAYDKGFDEGLEEGLKVGACEDAISRADAIDAIMRYLGRINRDFEAYRGTARIILNHLQPVQPKQRTGHWIERYSEGIGKWFECNQCGLDVKKPVNYCPNCGAKMEV